MTSIALALVALVVPVYTLYLRGRPSPHPQEDVQVLELPAAVDPVVQL